MCTVQRSSRTLLGRAPNSWRLRSGRAEHIRLTHAFERALDSMWIAFQPIVFARDGATYGYEALVRTREPALPNPEALLGAAEKLGRMFELGRRIRRLAFTAEQMSDASYKLFLNLHPYELLDDQLVSDVASVPFLAQRVVLEVTERSALGKVPNLPERLAALRESGCSIAIDDLGAGYSGLSSFVELEPDLVKLDMSLVRNADKSAMKQQLIGSLTAMCRNMGLSIVAEGIETREERDTVIALGCDLLQGYRFGRPSPSFLPPSW